MNSEKISYTVPSHGFHYENYGSFELGRGIVPDKTTRICHQIFCPSHFYSDGTCIAATRVFNVMTVGTAALWAPGTWLLVSGFNVLFGKVLVGKAASFTGLASLLTSVRDNNERRCCSNIVGGAADVALISILVCD